MTQRTPPHTRSRIGDLVTGLENKKRVSGKSQKTENFPKRNLINNMAGDNDEILNAMTVEQLREEVERLRQLNSLQNEQLATLRTQRNVNTGNLDNNLIQALIDGLRTMSTDIKLPKFEESENPNHFIEKLRKFFTVKKVADDNKLNILEGAFDGRVRAWFETKKNSFINYKDFEKKFLEEFYSIPIRVRIKSNWLAKRFEPNKESLNSYFLGQVQQAQYFLPKMEEYEVYYTIISQMPIRVRESLATIDFSNFNSISQASTQLDITFNDKINTQKKQTLSSTNNSQSNNTSSSNNNNNQNKSKINMRKIQAQEQIDSVAKSNETNNFLCVSNSMIDSSRVLSSVRPTGIQLPNMSIPPPSANIQTQRFDRNHMGQNHLNW